MSADLGALLAHARWLPARERAQLDKEWAAHQPPGTLLVSTCHRVELYGSAATLTTLARKVPSDVRWAVGHDVASHLIRLAIGRQSAVVGEDQVLHQLRVAARTARSRGGLPPELDRLLDIAMRAGRRARSWLPASKLSLADVALAQAVSNRDVNGAQFLVVGTGEMGRRAVGNLVARGGRVTIASRTIETARALAERFGTGYSPFDPGPAAVAPLAGIFIALAGPWLIGDQTRRAVLETPGWLVDLSVPRAIDEDTSAVRNGPFISIDDLGAGAGEPLSEQLLVRLDRLAHEAAGEYEGWLAAQAQRTAADALNRRAQAVQDHELERLWRRVPTLDDAQRVEVERALEGFARELLREPLEQMMDDSDGHRARAARDLFRL